MNIDIEALYGTFKKIVDNLPHNDNLYTYPNISDAVESRMRVNFNVHSNETILYAYDASENNDQTQGVVVTNVSIHYLQPASLGDKVSIYKWTEVSEVTISSKDVSFKTDVNHILPLSQLASPELVTAAFSIHHPPIVLLRSSNTISVNPQQKKNAQSWLTMVEAAVKIYSAKRVKNKNENKKNEKNSLFDFFGLLDEMRGKEKITYKTELPKITAKVQKLKKNGKLSEVINTISEFNKEYPNPSNWLWEANEYMEAKLYHHAIYCATSGLDLLKKHHAGNEQKNEELLCQLNSLKAKAEEMWKNR